jgi:hypothetical protein
MSSRLAKDSLLRFSLDPPPPFLSASALFRFYVTRPEGDDLDADQDAVIVQLEGFVDSRVVFGHGR